MTGLLVVLFLIAIAIAASPLIAVLIAAFVAVVAIAVTIMRRAGQAGGGASVSRNPRTGGAPASGEGSGAPTSSTGTTP